MAIFEVEEKLGGREGHDWSFSFEETERTTRKVLCGKDQKGVAQVAHLTMLI